jgi:hypothetical protein
MHNQLSIREALRHRSGALDPAAFALGCAVWEIRPAPQSHAECLIRLPSFVEAERGGQADSAEFLLARRHLHICPSCARIYLDLMELQARETAEGLSLSQRIPPPDLSFLDSADA